MKVRVYEYDASGREYLARETWLDNIYPERCSGYWRAMNELEKSGRYWLERGAHAPLTCLYTADRRW